MPGLSVMVRVHRTGASWPRGLPSRRSRRGSADEARGREEARPVDGADRRDVDRPLGRHRVTSSAWNWSVVPSPVTASVRFVGPMVRLANVASPPDDDPPSPVCASPCPRRLQGRRSRRCLLRRTRPRRSPRAALEEGGPRRRGSILTTCPTRRPVRLIRTRRDALRPDFRPRGVLHRDARKSERREGRLGEVGGWSLALQRAQRGQPPNSPLCGAPSPLVLPGVLAVNLEGSAGHRAPS